MSCEFKFQIAFFLPEQTKRQLVLNINQLCVVAPITTTNLLRKIYENQIIASPVNAGLSTSDFFEHGNLAPENWS